MQGHVRLFETDGFFGTRVTRNRRNKVALPSGIKVISYAARNVAGLIRVSAVLKGCRTTSTMR